MLKRNLFFIIVIGLVFVFTTNAFGQSNHRKSVKKVGKTNSIYLDGGNDSWNTRRKQKSKQRTANTSGNVNKPLKNNIPRQGGGTRGRSKN